MIEIPVIVRHKRLIKVKVHIDESVPSGETIIVIPEDKRDYKYLRDKIDELEIIVTDTPRRASVKNFIQHIFSSEKELKRLSNA